MNTRSCLGAIAISLLLAPPVQSQESLAERPDRITAFRYPEIERVTELPAAGEAPRLQLRPAVGDVPPSILRDYDDSRWREFGLVFAVFGGLLGLAYVGAFAEYSGDSLNAAQSLGVLVLSGFIAGTVGALIGGMIPK